MRLSDNELKKKLRSRALEVYPESALQNTIYASEEAFYEKTVREADIIDIFPCLIRLFRF